MAGMKRARALTPVNGIPPAKFHKHSQLDGSQGLPQRASSSPPQLCIDLTSEEEPAKETGKISSLPSPGELSDDVRASIESVSLLSCPPDTRWKDSCLVLHPYFKHEAVELILSSRAESGNDLRGKESGGNGEVNSCAFIGTITFHLTGNLDMGGVFREALHHLSLTFALYQCGNSSSAELQLNVGGTTWHLPVSTTPPGASWRSLQPLFKTSYSMRLFLPRNSSNNGCVSSLEVEVWSMGKGCQSGDPPSLESNSRSSEKRERINCFLKMLHPRFMFEMEEESLFGPMDATPWLGSVFAQVQQFYKLVRQQQQQRQHNSKAPPPTLPDIPGLLAILRGYQRRGVEWMLEREGARFGRGGEEEEEEEEATSLHVLWKKLPVATAAYFNPFTGRFSSQLYPDQGLPPGGILADEMGLGKTVEVLALILAHPWTNMAAPANDRSFEHVLCECDPHVIEDESWSVVQCEMCPAMQHSKCSGYSQARGFLCKDCRTPTPCKTTLIVCPASILPQWKEEISKHTQPGALKVLRYPGVTSSYFSPRELATYDIILVSYEKLRSELYHVTSQEFFKKLRRPKRFGALPSPLTALYWWRICLDEAQMVESKTSKAAEMMQKLAAVNRWCVSGTPVHKDLRDLHGLLMFLRVDPYDRPTWFRRLLWEPFLDHRAQPILTLFSHLMWRNAKQDVATELCLPDQTERVHWVQFSSVEEYFYRRQHEDCVNRIRLSHLGSAEQALSTLNQATVKSLLAPLHSLRQACCTPEIVRSGYLTRDPGRVPLSMKNLLKKLSQQAMVDAREALRQLVSALNGLAGIHILANKPGDAMHCYLEAVRFWQEYRKEHEVDCDKLQRIHALENLAALLKEFPKLAPKDLLTMDMTEPEVQQAPTEPGTQPAPEDGTEPLPEDNAPEDSMELELQHAPENRTEPGAQPAPEGGTELAPEDNAPEHSMEPELQHAPENRTEPEAQPAPEHSMEPELQHAPENRTEPEAQPAPEHSMEPELQHAPENRTEPEARPAPEHSMEPELQHAPENRTEPEAQPAPEHSMEPELQHAPENRTEPGAQHASEDVAEPEVQRAPEDGMELELQPPQKDPLPGDGMEPQAPGGSSSSQAKISETHPLSEEATLALKSQKMVEWAMGLRAKYSRKADVEVRAAQDFLVLAKRAVQAKVQGSSSTPWWLVMGIWAMEKGKGEELLDVITSEHLDHSYNSSKGFEDLNSVSCFLSLKMNAIESCHEQALAELDSISGPPSLKLIEDAASCHLTRDTRWPRCGYCKVESTMLHYESQIYSRFGYTETSGMEHGEGIRFASAFEQIIKCMVSFGRRNGAPKELLANGQQLIDFLDVLKKEYSAMRGLWLSIGERLGVHYELLQASIRIRFMTWNERVEGCSLPEVIEGHHEIPYRIHDAGIEKRCHHDKLKKCVGQLIYLKSLEKFQDEKDGNKELCPICMTAMGMQWGVLPCGHSLCVECMGALVNRYVSHSSQIPCPLCREKCRRKDINYAKLGVEPEPREEEEEAWEEEEKVRGLYSSKIVAVVQRLLRIRRKEPTAKALVFSSWAEVLGKISHCLTDNNITYHEIKGSLDFQSKLASFKTSSEVNVLLMPFQSGSKGLNIVEATHVLLVEPQLNMGVELQAVGRIHRMGQTKPTTVHRFIVRHSVEEKLYQLFHGSQNHTLSDVLLGDTTANLTCGELRALVVS